MSALSKRIPYLLLSLGILVSGCKEATREEKEFEAVEKSAKAGTFNAQFQLGLLHEKGVGTKQDVTMAIKCYKRGLELIDIEKKKLPTTLEGWKQLPANGVYASRVKCLIGRYYENDAKRSDMKFLHRASRNKDDELEAVKWYQQSAVVLTDATPHALLRLSELHENKAVGLEYLQNAAMLGSSEAKYRFAQLYLHDAPKLPDGKQLPNVLSTKAVGKFFEGLRLLEEAADMGNNNALRQLIYIYKGVEVTHFEAKDVDKAWHFERKTDELWIAEYDYDTRLWFAPEGMRIDLAWMVPSLNEGTDIVFLERISALNGDAKAQYNLSVYLAYGKGIRKDQQEAAKWCKKSADSGYPPALLSTGNRFYEGNGVIKDEIEAYAYWNLSGVEIDKARGYVKKLESKLSESARLRAQQRSVELQKEIQASKFEAGRK